MSDSSKRRDAIFGLSRTAPARRSARVQKAVSSVIETLENRTLFAANPTAVIYNVGGDGSGPSLPVPATPLQSPEAIATLAGAVTAIDGLPTSVTAVTINFAATAGTTTAPGTIDLAGGLTITPTSLTGFSLTINGAKAIIISGTGSPLLTLAPAAGGVTTALVENITFTGATAGAISTSVPLTLTTDTFTSDAAGSGNGGAVSSTASKLTVSTSTFTNDSATDGGAIADVASVASSSLVLTTDVFTGNTASAGGAVYSNLSGGTLVTAVEGSTFASNSATVTDGGAIDSNGTTLDVGVGVTIGTTVVAAAKNTFANLSVSHVAQDNMAAGNGGAIASTDTTMAVGLSIFGTIGTGLDGTPSNVPAANNSADNGGAIYANGGGSSALTITGSSFYNDSAAGGNGGAVDNLDHSLTVGTSIFGAIATFTGAVPKNLAAGNTAANGGAIATTAVNNTFNITNTFAANVATGNGGAIWASTSGTPILNITTDTFTGNSADNGGALYTTTSSTLVVNINGGTFAANTANAGLDDNGGNGGAIDSNGTTLQIGVLPSKVTFSANKAESALNMATAGNGGSIYSTDNMLIIYSCSFGTTTATGSSAAENGGALYFDGSGATPTATITNTNFEDCSTTTADGGTSAGDGGAIYNSDTGSLTLAGQLNNSAHTLAANIFTSDTAGHSGGAIYSLGSSATTFTDNNASFTSDTATNNNGGAIASGDNALAINGSVFSKDVAKGSTSGYGGAVYFTGGSLITATYSPLHTTIYKTSFVSDYSYSDGGSVFFAGTTATPSLSMTLTTFTSDDAGYAGTTVLLHNTASQVADGGGVALEGYNTATFSFTSDTFTKCTAAADGGAIFDFGDAPFGAGVSTTLNLTAADTFSGDTAGGAYISLGVNGQNVVTEGNGGAVYSDGDNVNVNGATFKSDLATGYDSISVAAPSDRPNYGFGGGLYSTATLLNITGATSFSSDIASFGGGGVYFGPNDPTTPTGTGNITGTSFSADTANYAIAAGNTGYDVSFGGGICSESDTTNLSGITVNGCIAATDGGGVYDDSLNLNVSGGSKFGVTTANKANQSNGGAIYYGAPAGTASITFSTFSKNAVSGTGAEGGAIAAGYEQYNNVGVITSEINAAVLIVGNDSFTSDTATGAGGAVYSAATSTSVYQCVFVSNKSSGDDGGGIFADQGTTLELFDSCIDANSALGGGGVAFGGDTADIANVTFFKNVSTTAGGGGLLAVGTGTQTITECSFNLNTAGGPTLGAGIYAGAFTAASAATPGLGTATDTNGGTVILQGDVLGGNTTTVAGNIPVFGGTGMHAIAAGGVADLAGLFSSSSSFNVIGDGSTEVGIQNIAQDAGDNNNVGIYSTLASTIGFSSAGLTINGVAGLTPTYQSVVLLTAGNGVSKLNGPSFPQFTVDNTTISPSLIPLNVTSQDQFGALRNATTDAGAAANSSN